MFYSSVSDIWDNQYLETVTKKRLKFPKMLQEKNPQFCQIAMKNNYTMGGYSAFQKKRFFDFYVLSKMGSL